MRGCAATTTFLVTIRYDRHRRGWDWNGKKTRRVGSPLPPAVASPTLCSQASDPRSGSDLKVRSSTLQSLTLRLYAPELFADRSLPSTRWILDPTVSVIPFLLSSFSFFSSMLTFVFIDQHVLSFFFFPFFVMEMDADSQDCQGKVRPGDLLQVQG